MALMDPAHCGRIYPGCPVPIILVKIKGGFLNMICMSYLHIYNHNDGNKSIRFLEFSILFYSRSLNENSLRF